MGVGKTSIYKCLNADFLDTRTKKQAAIAACLVKAICQSFFFSSF